MKTIKLLVILFMLGTVISCSKDDDTNNNVNPGNNPLMSGKWYMETLNGTVYSACEKRSSTEFTTNGTMLITSFSIDADSNCSSFQVALDYIISGNVISAYIDISDDTEDPIVYTYSISNNILTLTYTNEADETQVLTLDKTEG